MVLLLHLLTAILLMNQNQHLDYLKVKHMLKDTRLVKSEQPMLMQTRQEILIQLLVLQQDLMLVLLLMLRMFSVHQISHLFLMKQKTTRHFDQQTNHTQQEVLYLVLLLHMFTILVVQKLEHLNTALETPLLLILEQQPHYLMPQQQEQYLNTLCLMQKCLLM